MAGGMGGDAADGSSGGNGGAQLGFSGVNGSGSGDGGGGGGGAAGHWTLPGGTGGRGGAGGASGGLGGTSFNPNGNHGVNSTSNAGAGGGGGGYSAFSGSGLSNAVALAGGNGGNGGTAEGTTIFTDGGGGGGGGEGGYGAVISEASANVNSGSIVGGNGGFGGNAVAGGGGSGGDGGVGVYFLSGGTLANSGTISGGAGRSGGIGDEQVGMNGRGGAGIYGSNLTIYNSGTISGGFGSSRANAITFTGGTNTLSILSGSGMLGLASGGGNDTLDYSTYGAGGVTVDLSTGAATGTGGVSSFETIIGSAFADRLTGNAGANTLNGLGGNDTLLAGSGTDALNGGADFDVLYFGAYISAGDVADGGPGTDVLVLQGDYSSGYTFSAGNLANIESISVRNGTDTRWGDTAGNVYDYNIATHDANVAAGQQMIVNAQSLRATEDFTFNGSAETDGRFLVYAGNGVDTLTGGAGNDVFFFEGARFHSADRIHGGDGRDTVVISLGSGANYVAFGPAQWTGIEAISLNGRFASDPSQVPSYSIVLRNGNVDPVAGMIVNGSALGGTQTLQVNGADVIGGNLTIFGGDGADGLVGGQQQDVLYGGNGADTLQGNAGHDIYRYDAVSHSTSASRDLIAGFTLGDLLDLSRIDANPGAIGDQSFTFIGSNAFAGTGAGSAGQLRFQSDGGTAWLVQADADGNGVADFEVRIGINDLDPITASDFIL